MNTRLVKFYILIVVVAMLAACGEDKRPVTAPQNTSQTNQSSPAPVVDQDDAAEDMVEKYVYNPIGKRDPFENPLQAIVEVTSPTGVPLTPLQKFDLGQLRLIGVIVGKGQPRGMVIAPDGKSFILSIGTKIGKNDGAVIDITTDAVLVKEKYYDFTGEIRTSIQEIKLPKQGGV